MCGIFGYIGVDDPLTLCIKGLERLEYRGYDSAGVAGVIDGKISICKETGKLQRLKEKIRAQKLEMAIGHTRWATHGKVTESNAHPHYDKDQHIAIVHNGIIENYNVLKQEFDEKHFHSETDTEVIAHLIVKHYRGDLVEAVSKTLMLLRGQFAIAVIHKDHPDQMVAAARESPLSIGYDDLHSCAMISSDPNAFLGQNLNILSLRGGEIARVQKEKVEVFDKTHRPVIKKTEKLDLHHNTASKEGFAHFMLKEIYEQPATIQNVIASAQLESLPEEFMRAKRVWLIGCGTSAHAGIIGSFFLEDIAHIPTHCEIASEARFRIIPEGTLIIAISQSGETADTVAATREIRSRGFKVLGICNVKNSTLTRETDACIFLQAGPEMSVCSTKAFTSQIALLYLLALKMGKKKTLEGLETISKQIEDVLTQAPSIQKIAQKYSRYNHFFFMGRRYMYPTAMESALKLKEISYVNANAYPAGELKHGPIALIDSQFPVIAFCANQLTEDKILSNLQEVKARGAPTLAIAPTHLKAVGSIADEVIWLSSTSDALSPFASTVAGQLLAYYIALARGCDIDQPRNLAKSVTVE